jgi:hypothetical protein
VWHPGHFSHAEPARSRPQLAAGGPGLQRAGCRPQVYPFSDLPEPPSATQATRPGRQLEPCLAHWQAGASCPGALQLGRSFATVARARMVALAPGPNGLLRAILVQSPSRFPLSPTTGRGRALWHSHSHKPTAGGAVVQVACAVKSVRVLDDAVLWLEPLSQQLWREGSNNRLRMSRARGAGGCSPCGLAGHGNR